MSKEVSRRSFIKAAGAGVGVAVAAGYNPLSYGANERVRVACIGTGGQGSFHIRDGLSRARNIEIVAVCDVYRPHLEGGYQNAGAGNVKKYIDYREMLDREQFDAAVIATPLHTHYPITMDCLSAGKHCFTEKTLCYEIGQCRDVAQLSFEKGLVLQVGHQRRYNPLYNKALRLAWEDGVCGRINQVECQWHRNNDWRRPVMHGYQLSPEEARWIPDLERHINWRLYWESSGGLMAELATHQVDIASWYLDAMPRRVFGCGGLDYWRDGRDVFDNVSLVYEFEISPDSRGYRAINARNAFQDRQAINAPYTVRMVYSSICANAKRGASEVFLGDEGSIELNEYGGLYYPEATSTVEWLDEGVRSEADAAATVITSGGTLELSNVAQTNAKDIRVDSDRSVGQTMFEDFADRIRYGGASKANAMVGLRAAVMGIAGMMAIRDGGRVVDIDPAWYSFDYPTPDPSMYS